MLNISGKWRVRYNVIVLGILINLVAFLDRANFSTAAPFIARDLHLNSSQIGLIMSAFLVGYGYLQILGGLFADKFGPRKGIIVAIVCWSFFTLFTGFGGGFISLLIIRFLFGVGEAFYPPAGFKMLSIWFPKKELLLANSLGLSAQSLAPALAPLLVVAIIHFSGWQSVFYLFSIPGFILVYFIWKNYFDNPAEHPKMTKQELIEINEGTESAGPAAKMTILQALRVPNLLILCLTYFFFDITYWGFYSWLPSYLKNVRHFSDVYTGIAAAIPFFAGFLCTLSANFVHKKLFRGINKKFMLPVLWVIGAITMYLAYNANDARAAIAYLAITAGLGIFMAAATFWSVVTETLPSQSMGFLTSLINGAGKIGGAISPALIGLIIDKTGSFNAGFVTMEIALLIAAAILLFIRNEERKQTSYSA